jgi:signal peptidase II
LAKQVSKTNFPHQIWMLVVSWAVILLDQGTKYLAIENLEPYQPVNVLGDVLKFTLVYNDSAAFSIGFGMTWIFTILSSAATIVLLWLSRKIETRGWAVMAGVLLGGVVGNLIDRLARDPGFAMGHVVDFLQLPFGFAVFNLADVAIVAIASLTVIRVMRGDTIGRKSTPTA